MVYDVSVRPRPETEQERVVNFRGGDAPKDQSEGDVLKGKGKEICHAELVSASVLFFVKDKNRP